MSRTPPVAPDPDAGPVFDPPLGHDEWRESRDRMTALGERCLGPERAQRLVRSEVLLTHRPSKAPSPPARWRGTRLGGGPRLAPGTPWPSAEGRPLDLLAVVDCAELAEVGSREALPDDGWLNFFYDSVADPADHAFPTPDDPVLDAAPERGWRVLYAGADVGELAPPEGAVVHPERPVRRTYTLPWTGVEEFALGDDTEGHIADLYEEWEAIDAPLMPSVYPLQEGTPVHLLGGWPLGLQGPVLEAPEWRLLLQLDTDEALGWSWGDAGRLYFGITERDLAARDFGRVWVTGQSH
ncbi:YwqG family protein [Streptomyces sedi]|uniref:DUF1963 domain-containing protein n=1 Tax=Streptomyces sedi TaxID=555059 RepID=A0A5C4V0Q0_9ACTN|nr:YwqG family protein [Streptomyces sedi]TNM29434.1 DUF1963 domain-containing protein [Streptomyces sedi]